MYYLSLLHVSSEQAAARKGVSRTPERDVQGALGRAYFVPVRPVHRVIVPAMLRAAARRLAGAQP